MRTITVLKTVKEPVSLMVEFPVFRKVEDEECKVAFARYMSWDEDDSEWCITKTDHGNQVEWSVKRDAKRLLTMEENVDYVLGRGVFSLTREQWNDVVNKMLAFVGRLRP